MKKIPQNSTRHMVEWEDLVLINRARTSLLSGKWSNFNDDMNAKFCNVLDCITSSDDSDDDLDDDSDDDSLLLPSSSLLSSVSGA